MLARPRRREEVLSSRRVIETRTRVYLNRHVSWIAFKSACVARSHTRAAECLGHSRRRLFFFFPIRTAAIGHHHQHHHHHYRCMDDRDTKAIEAFPPEHETSNERQVLKVVQFARGSTRSFPPFPLPPSAAITGQRLVRGDDHDHDDLIYRDKSRRYRK